MRKITEQAVQAFMKGRDWKGGNMAVIQRNVWTEMYLHGKLIARRDPLTRTTEGTMAGRPTVTTRERLNGIAEAVGGVGVYQRNHAQYTDDDKPLGDNEWFTLYPVQA